MNNYEVKGNCMYSGAKCTRSIDAESEEKARVIALDQGLSAKSIEIKASDIAVVEPVKINQEIVDAEDLLYEMDMSGVDTITTSEFTGRSSVSRDQVVAALHKGSIKK
jgi:hypothetical protein